MENRLKEVIFKIAHYTEVVVSVLIIGSIIMMLLGLLKDFFSQPMAFLEIEQFHEFLSSALTLVVGLEFVNLLCKHTSETLIEVLMLATARQMVVEHLDTAQTLIGIIGLAVLFAIRKYLLLGEKGKEEDKL